MNKLTGHNYRMTEIQAALGISQLKRLDDFVLKRHVIKNKYDKDLKDLPIIKPYQIMIHTQLCIYILFKLF